MSYQTEASDNQDQSDALTAIKRQAKARRLRTIAGVVALAVLLVFNVSLSVTALIVGLSSNDRANDTHNQVQATLGIVKTATNPQAQKQQIQTFYNTETAIFRQDCDAKAHQLTKIDNDLGGRLDLATLQAFCAEIQAPPLP